jgi:hypothetical protein
MTTATATQAPIALNKNLPHADLATHICQLDRGSSLTYNGWLVRRNFSDKVIASKDGQENMELQSRQSMQKVPLCMFAMDLQD